MSTYDYGALPKKAHRSNILHKSQTMKLILGFENNGSIDRVSSELQSKGINMLKCIPYEFPAVGLVRFPQLGFSQYRDNLPAFMQANDISKRVPLLAEGYPIKIPSEKCIPFSLPPISVTFDKVPDSFKSLRETASVEDVSVKGKQTGFLVQAQPGILSKVLRTSPDTKAYSPVGSVGSGEYPSLVTIIRILSSFFSIHTYPAYSNEEDFKPEENHDESVSKRKADLSTGNEGIPLNAKRRIVSDNGISVSITIEDNIAEEVVLRYARVPSTKNAGWGGVSSIPVTSGIVCPYIPELASWDKDTVPKLIERYFLRCLGSSTNSCLHGFSRLSQDWKKSIYKTDIGNSLTHLAKLAGLCLASETRLFPIFEGSQYLGSYLSGAHFSIGLRGSLVLPQTYAENKPEFDGFSSHESNLSKFVMEVAGSDADEEDVELALSSNTMRELHSTVMSKFSVDFVNDDLSNLKKLRFPQAYLTINMQNVSSVCEQIMTGEFATDLPMHYSAFGSNDPFKLGLAAFGPSPPSPNIPGAPKIKFSGKVPTDKDLPRLLVFRKCALDIAVSDWKECLETGYVGNNPPNLNARYANVKVSGLEDKRSWYQLLKKMSDDLVSKHLDGDIKVTRGIVDLGGDDHEDVGLGGF